jgi:hypothetical protein
MEHPSMYLPAFEVLAQEMMRFDFTPLCFSFAFVLCPWRTASVVPTIAGQAAIAVSSPRTMVSWLLFGVEIISHNHLIRK